MCIEQIIGVILRIFDRFMSPAPRIQPELHCGAVPVVAAREALVGRIEVNRLHQLWPDTGTLRDDTLNAH